MSFKRELFKSTAIVSLMNLTGKVLAFAKTLTIAAVFGTSASLDAFWVAYMLPMFLPPVLLSMVRTAFIPTFMKSLDGRETSDTWQGANTLFTSIAVFFVLATLFFTQSATLVVNFTAPGLAPDAARLAAELLEVMAWATLLLGLSSCLSAISQARNRFYVSSLEGILSNGSIIVFCVIGVQDYGIWCLPYAIILGAFLQLCCLVFENRREIAVRLRPRMDFSHPDFRTTAKHMVPLAIGSTGALFMSIVDQFFASKLEPGAISVLGYAAMVMMIPSEIFGRAIMMTFYPSLSKAHAATDPAGMNELRNTAVRLFFLIMVPSSALMFVYSEDIVRIIYGRGSFSEPDLERTAVVLMAMVVGILPRALSYFNFSVFHSMVRPWIPIRLGFLEVAINAFLTWKLYAIYGVMGIALATAIALTITMIISSVILSRALGSSLASLIFPLLKILAATAVLLISSEAILTLLGFSPDVPLLKQVAFFGLATGAGAVFFTLTARALGLEEAKAIQRKVAEKMFS